MSDEDEGKWQALRNELSRPSRESAIYENTDVLEPEPEAEQPTWKKTYGREYLWWTDDFPEEQWGDDNALFEPYEADGKRGYFVKRRAE